jgi:mono/diheme cytochrome c family protein
MRPLVPFVPGFLAVLAAGFVTGGCGDHEFEPPPEEAQVAHADSLYSPALFDSITWSSDQARIQAGNLVFADECRRCHGPLGRGETDYAAEHELEVPSLVTEDWEYRDDIQAVQRVIFTGHVGGMPDWGPTRLTPREIDAAAFYLLELLRPEVLADSVSDLPGID